MAASSSDIRDWLREQGRDMPANGRLRKADREAYERAHAAPEDDDGGLSYPGDPDGADSASAAQAEQAPRAARTSARKAASGWLGRGRGQKSGKGAGREKRTFPRVPLTSLIEHSYSEIAWAAKGIPPLSRMLEAQAPLAGVVFEDTVRDTAIDRMLQPAARLEAALDATYGMLAPPLYVMAVLATAPDPAAADPRPSMAHKSALLGLRHSLMVMARVSRDSLEKLVIQAEETTAREQDVDMFIDYLFHGPQAPEADGQEQGDGRAGLLAAAGIGAAD